MKYTVYEIFPDGKCFWRFESEDKFECEVYVGHHKYDNPRSKSTLIIARVDH